jgi:hypothetical protein
MQFTSTLLFAATALFSLATANTVEFVNQDGTTRNIVFTPQEGLAAIDTIVLEGHGTANVTFPVSWIGNWYSYNEGSANVPGMLGEVRWDGFAGANYFDVSAIVNPSDHNGVKMIFPKNSNEPLSGCQTFPCSNAYNQPNDIATLSTPDHTLVCLVGTLSSARRRSLARMPREFIEV